MINMLLYIIIGIFVAGMMVGRTPEYLGKKMGREVKLAIIALLVHPLMILLPTGSLLRLTGDSRPSAIPVPTVSHKCSTSSLRLPLITARPSTA